MCLTKVIYLFIMESILDKIPFVVYNKMESKLYILIGVNRFEKQIRRN